MASAPPDGGGGAGSSASPGAGRGGSGEGASLLDPRVLARLKGLSLRASRVVDGVLQGVHRSPHRGTSIEFAEHKEYSPGDEIRHIDWRAYARLDKHYVKRFEHETNLQTWTLLDASASMDYGAEGMLSKFDYAATLAVSLAFVMLRQQDATGAVLFADEVETVLPPRTRLSHLQRVGDALERVSPHGGTDVGVGLRRLSERARRRGMVYVLSDFLTPLEEPLRYLRQLVGRGHEVCVFHVLDGDELDFPFEAMSLFEGMETTRRLLVEPKLVRDAYLERMEAHRRELRRSCLRAGVDYVLVDTREPPDRILLNHLAGAGRGAGPGRGAGQGAL